MEKVYLMILVVGMRSCSGWTLNRENRLCLRPGSTLDCQSFAVCIPGVPKKVHKFEIKNLCSVNRSINKVGVIC